MGSQPLRAELSEPTTVALGLRPSACKPSRPVSGRGQGRKPPEAVARSASLEAGRSPVYFQHSYFQHSYFQHSYFQHSCSGGRDGGGYRSDLGQRGTGIFLQTGLDRANQVERVQEIALLTRPARGKGSSRRNATVIPGRCEASNPESRDSPMRNCASEVWSFGGPSRNDGICFEALPF
jgi:hypothetical protein